jgi:hypothetical protein
MDDVSVACCPVQGHLNTTGASSPWFRPRSGHRHSARASADYGPGTPDAMPGGFSATRAAGSAGTHVLLCSDQTRVRRCPCAWRPTPSLPGSALLPPSALLPAPLGPQAAGHDTVGAPSLWRDRTLRPPGPAPPSHCHSHCPRSLASAAGRPTRLWGAPSPPGPQSPGSPGPPAPPAAYRARRR